MSREQITYLIPFYLNAFSCDIGFFSPEGSLMTQQVPYETLSSLSHPFVSLICLFPTVEGVNHFAG